MAGGEFGPGLLQEDQQQEGKSRGRKGRGEAAGVIQVGFAEGQLSSGRGHGGTEQRYRAWRTKPEPGAGAWQGLGPPVERSGSGSVRPRSERGLAGNLGESWKPPVLHVSIL